MIQAMASLFHDYLDHPLTWLIMILITSVCLFRCIVFPDKVSETKLDQKLNLKGGKAKTVTTSVSGYAAPINNKNSHAIRKNSQACKYDIKEVDVQFALLKYNGIQLKHDHHHSSSTINLDKRILNCNHNGEMFRDCYLEVTSNNKVAMNDETIELLLSEVANMIKELYCNNQHMCALYDLRAHILPRFSEANSRVKQLVSFCESLSLKDENGNEKQMIDHTLHTVAVVIPSGFTSKMLKKLIDFFLWITKPPMDPRVFEGDISAAYDFINARRQAYLDQKLALVPTTTSSTSTSTTLSSSLRSSTHSVSDKRDRGIITKQKLTTNRRGGKKIHDCCWRCLRKNRTSVQKGTPTKV